jgi:hypothetical protein
LSVRRKLSDDNDVISVRRRLSVEKISPYDKETYVANNFVATSKALSSFVPNTLMAILIENIATNNYGKMKPFSCTFRDICLLADISEFTRITGTFCETVKDGLDDLHSALIGYMGSLVDTIYSFGGDVIKFAGDALECIFQPTDVTEESFQRSCANAIQCAWVLKDITMALKDSVLSSHVGISCGDICLGQLGGFENRWECLISGSCLSQLWKCLDDAPSKHVVITHECFYSSTEVHNPFIDIIATKKKSGIYLIEKMKVKILSQKQDDKDRFANHA